MLAAPPGGVTRIGRFWVGDHWAVLAGSFLAIAHQTAILGLAATLYGAREGYRVVTPFLRGVYWATRLEHMLLTGAVLVAGGTGVLATCCSPGAPRATARSR